MVSGVWDITGSAVERDGVRYCRFLRWLDWILKEHGLPNEIVYEKVRFHGRNAGVDAPHLYGALKGLLLVWCEIHKVRYRGLWVATVKKFATGNGNAKKAIVLEAAQRRWPQACIEDDNEADARWVAATHAAKMVQRT
jgi:Holliday junction resolvasome RuvABC endonuclease subunit